MSGTTISPVDRTIIEEEHLRHYQINTDYVDPLEEFIVQNNRFTDHTLYMLTHSPSFQNLRVIDMRKNPLNSLLTLKINAHQFQAPNLEELYVETDTNNASYNISFIFTGFNESLQKLKVLWINSNSKSVYIKREHEHELISKLSFTKLYLRNIKFKDDLAQELFDNLDKCEELSLKLCSFELYGAIDALDKFDTKVSKSNAKTINSKLSSKKNTKIEEETKKINLFTLNLSRLKSLKSLSIEKSTPIIAPLTKSKYLQNSLHTLRLSNAHSQILYQNLSSFIYLSSLQLVGLNLLKLPSKSKSVFPNALQSLEIISCSLNPETLFQQLNKCTLVSLSLLDINYSCISKSSKTGLSLPTFPFIITFSFDDSLHCLLNTPTDLPYNSLKSKFPNLKDVIYYKNVEFTIPTAKIPFLTNQVTSLTQLKSCNSITVACPVPKIPFIASLSNMILTKGLFEFAYDFNKDLKSLIDE